MIVKTTEAYPSFYEGITKQGFTFPNGAYFSHAHRVLDETETFYETVTNYPISKGEEVNIPDEVANTPEFQAYFTQGLLEEVI